MSLDQKFTIEISNQEFHYKQSIDLIQKAKIISFLELPDAQLIDIDTSKSTSTPELGINSITPNVSGSINKSPREYLEDKNAITIPQKILVFISYLRTLGNEYVSVDEIKQLFEKTREIMPTNFKRDFDKTIKKTWVSENSQGKFYITDRGEEAVNTKFANIGSRGTRKRTIGGKRIALPIRKEVSELDLSSSETEGLKNYWDLKKVDKILWILAVAQSVGIDDLNYKEIAVLADKMRDSLPPKQITSLTSTHLKSNRIGTTLINNIRVLRILKPGIDYLKPIDKIDNARGSA